MCTLRWASVLPIFCGFWLSRLEKGPGADEGPRAAPEVPFEKYSLRILRRAWSWSSLGAFRRCSWAKDSHEVFIWRPVVHLQSFSFQPAGLGRFGLEELLLRIVMRCESYICWHWTWVCRTFCSLRHCTTSSTYHRLQVHDDLAVSISLVWFI